MTDEHEHDHSDHEHDHDEHEHEHEHEHVHTYDWATELEMLRADAAHFYEHQFDWRGQQPPPGYLGPRWFPPAPDFRLAARIDRHAQGAGDHVQLATSTGQLRHMEQIGDLVFEYGGSEHRLTAFLTQGHEGVEQLFVPFRDATSGKETYGAGRYIDMPYEDGEEQIELDFNFAYNPSCVYSPAYDCPYPPAQNKLSIAIPAGERLPYDSQAGPRARE